MLRLSVNMALTYNGEEAVIHLYFNFQINFKYFLDVVISTAKHILWIFACVFCVHTYISQNSAPIFFLFFSLSLFGCAEYTDLWTENLWDEQ